MMTVFDELLGIIPSTAARCHRDGNEEARYDHTEEHGTNSREGCARSGNQQDYDVQNNR